MQPPPIYGKDFVFLEFNLDHVGFFSIFVCKSLGTVWMVVSVFLEEKEIKKEFVGYGGQFF